MPLDVRQEAQNGVRICLAKGAGRLDRLGCLRHERGRYSRCADEVEVASTCWRGEASRSRDLCGCHDVRRALAVLIIDLLRTLTTAKEST